MVNQDVQDSISILHFGIWGVLLSSVIAAFGYFLTLIAKDGKDSVGVAIMVGAGLLAIFPVLLGIIATIILPFEGYYTWELKVFHIVSVTTILCGLTYYVRK